MHLSLVDDVHRGDASNDLVSVDPRQGLAFLHLGGLLDLGDRDQIRSVNLDGVDAEHGGTAHHPDRHQEEDHHRSDDSCDDLVATSAASASQLNGNVDVGNRHQDLSSSNPTRTGPTKVTSPAPRVMTRSPGRTSSARASGRSCLSGT